MKWHGKRAFWRRFIAIAILPVCIWAAIAFAPDWESLLSRAALASAMMQMPQGTAELLRQKYTAPHDEPASAAMSPWPAPAAPAATPAPTPKAQQPQPPAAEPTRPLELKQPAPAAQEPPDIPAAYQGQLLQENMAGSGSPLIALGDGLLRNYTSVSQEEIEEIFSQGLNITLEDTDEPQVLIFHTHTTESYEEFDSEIFDVRNTWRNTDNNKNMAIVGEQLAQTLRDAGISVIHDTTQHDYPSYNGAYERSAETVRKYLEKYPSIKIALDVHRDAILRDDDLIVKPVVEIDGEKAAQLMIITGTEDGTMGVPNWRENLRFATSLQSELERLYPQITRPIFFCYRKYNMDLTTGSLLLEFGSNANTLEESLRTANYVGHALASLLGAETENSESVTKSKGA